MIACLCRQIGAVNFLETRRQKLSSAPLNEYFANLPAGGTESGEVAKNKGQAIARSWVFRGVLNLF